MIGYFARWNGAFRAAILVAGMVIMTLRPAVSQQPADGAHLDGILSVAWGDPRPGRSGGTTRFSMNQEDGTEIALRVREELQGKILQLSGKRVIVFGKMTRGAPGKTEFVVDRIEADRVAREGPARRSGQKTMLYILLRFKDDLQQPHPPDYYFDMTFPDQSTTLNNYFGTISSNNLSWAVRVVGQAGPFGSHWARLPKTKQEYAPCGWDDACADLEAIKNDGLALAIKAGVDVSLFDQVNFVLSNDLDCCAWGGTVVYNGRSYGATWMPPWGQEVSTYAHELGHSIGLPHSGWVYHAYDSPWDMMSEAQSGHIPLQVGSYYSANDARRQKLFSYTPGSGIIAAYKDYLGWIPAANIAVINRAVTRTITLEGAATPVGSGIKMIKICYKDLPCTGPDAQYLTVEARFRGSLWLDDGLPGDGVIIHDFKAGRAPRGNGNSCFFNTQSGWAVPIDATRGDYRGQPACDSGGRAWPNYALGNAQFLPGQTYSNPQRHISVAIIQQQLASYVIRVTRSE